MTSNDWDWASGCYDDAALERRHRQDRSNWNAAINQVAVKIRFFSQDMIKNRENVSIFIIYFLEKLLLIFKMAQRETGAKTSNSCTWMFAYYM